jgi:hypothetical protein
MIRIVSPRRHKIARGLTSAILSLATLGTLMGSPAALLAQEADGAEVPAGPAAPASPPPVSVAYLADEATFLDRLEVRVYGLAPAPEGAAYRVWLRSETDPTTLYAGDLTVSETGSGTWEGALSYSEPRGETLFAEFSQVVVTLETGPAPPVVPRTAATPPAPAGTVVLRGQVDPGALIHARRLLVRWADSRYGTASVQGMRQLGSAARGHAATLREAAAAGDLDAMRRKAEHLVNMMEGQRGASFGDHNRDGRAEDPGDGVGFLPYAWAALTHSQFAWAAAADEAVAAEALEVQRPVRFSLDWAGFVRDAGLELARTTDIVRARELATHLSRAVDRMAAGVDPSTDPVLRQTLDDFTGGQLTPAYAEALALVRMPLS